MNTTTKPSLRVTSPINRLVGDMPKVGIRPTIDGRLGGVRESLEKTTMTMAKNVAKLIESTLRHSNGLPVQCVIADSCIGGVAEAAMAAYAQGKFWEMHDLLFASQQSLDRPTFEQHAQALVEAHQSGARAVLQPQLHLGGAGVRREHLLEALDHLPLHLEEAPGSLIRQRAHGDHGKARVELHRGNGVAGARANEGLLEAGPQAFEGLGVEAHPTDIQPEPHGIAVPEQ